MPAVIFLLISFFFGRFLMKKSDLSFATLFPDTLHLMPAQAFDLPFAFILGTTLLTTLHYLLALLSASLFRRLAPDSMALANIIFFSLAFLFILIRLIFALMSLAVGKDESKARFLYRKLYKRLSGFFINRAEKPPVFFSVSFLIFTLFSVFLISYSFFVKDGILYSGYSVFSDFSPHTAVISSFAYGDNFPTQYPHFAGDGINYHFFFFYLSALLLRLGLRFDFAMNLPSILGILAFVLLLGSFGVILTRKKGVFFLAPAMLFFRSSSAIFSYLGDLRRNGISGIVNTFKAVLDTNIFIGASPHDDWGLWSMNVYANQRHLLWGASAMLMVIMVMQARSTGPLKLEGDSFLQKTGEYLFSARLWRAGNLKGLLPLLVLVAFLPYWHGSTFLAMMIYLFVMALFSRERLSYLLLAATGAIFSLLQSAFFSDKSSSPVSPRFLFGFIAEDKTLAGLAVYLYQVIGLALLFILVLPFLKPERKKSLLFAGSWLLIIFTFTVSLTPDVTVNHKYLILALSIMNIYIASAFFDMWSYVKKLFVSLPVQGILAGVLALFISFSLFATGFVEFIGYKNKNRNHVQIDLNSSLTLWIKENTQTDDVFLTEPFHMHPLLFSGRKIFYGWPYFTMTAGHDTESRLEVVKDLYSGCNNNYQDFLLLAQKHKITYLTLPARDGHSQSEYFLNYDFFDRHLSLVADFGLSDNLLIYRIH